MDRRHIGAQGETVRQTETCLRRRFSVKEFLQQESFTGCGLPVTS